MAKKILDAPVLLDAHGRPIYSGGITRDDVRDAIQAAALADDFQTAQDVADRHGLKKICLNCGEHLSRDLLHHNSKGSWRVCRTCADELTPKFSDVKMMTMGLIKRDVQ